MNKGATVRADDTLNVNVGNNLNVESVQDTATSSNHGFNISGGFPRSQRPPLGMQTLDSLNSR